MNDTMEPEIFYAATLGKTFARMRAELSEAALERVLNFTFARYAIHAAIVRIDPMPDTNPPPNRVPIHAATCPICSKTTINNRGLNTHMHMKHGTTIKEYARQRALDAQQDTP